MPSRDEHLLFWRLTCARVNIPVQLPVLQRRLVSSGEIEKDIGRFLQSENARLGGFVGEIFQGHCGQSNEIESIAENCAAVGR